MKKNMMMRLASVLLIAVLMSTCAISGTFAKYVTSDEGTDSARVAKFGVVIDAKGSTFAGEYATDDNDVKGTIAKSVVTSGDMKNLVAPGTKGDMVAMTISGIPEVAVNVKFEATLTLTDWVVDGKEYCPIIFTVNGATYGMNFTTATNKYDTVAALEDAVEAAILAYSANYAPHTDLAVETTVGTPDVSWAWPFSTSTENDEKDTVLGDADKAATIELTIKTTVTQIN